MKFQPTMRVISLLLIQPAAKHSNLIAIQKNVRVLKKYPKNHNHNSSKGVSVGIPSESLSLLCSSLFQQMT